MYLDRFGLHEGVRAQDRLEALAGQYPVARIFIAAIVMTSSVRTLSQSSSRNRSRQPRLPVPADEVVAIDCETTGLNVRTDDVITIAAIKIRGNRILTSDRFEAILRPDALVRARSDQGTSSAPDRHSPGSLIWKALPRFLHFVGGRPLVGYYVDFDIAMLDKYILTLIGIELPTPHIEVSKLCY